jgi:multidrug efflux system membrane fusion protein
VRHLLLSLASVLSLGACARSAAAPHPAAGTRPVVRAAPVSDTILARPIVATGTLAPRDEVPLSFKIGGVIAHVEVDPGDAVHTGQRLAALELREINAGLAKARSGSEKAERDLARAERLYRDSVMTLAQLQDSRTATEVARADLDAAAFNRRYAEILAPAAGTVLRRLAEPGQTVAAGAPVLMLGSRARGQVVKVALADRDAVAVHKDDPASVTFDALPGRAFAGRVTQLAGTADPSTGAYDVEITVADPRGLVAGLVGRVEIRPAAGAPASLVPVEAVLEADAGHATVFALSTDRTRAERRRVTVAFIDGGRVAVTGGLEGARAVVTDGAAYLDDGAAVRVAP